MIALDISDVVLADDLGYLVAQAIFVVGVAGAQDLVDPLFDERPNSQQEMLVLTVNVRDDPQFHFASSSLNGPLMVSGQLRRLVTPAPH